MKKLISVILVLTLLFSFAAVPTSAESATDTLTSMLENDISVDSTNSFGGLLSQTINSEMEKQLANNGFNVFSIEYNDGEALVDLEVLQDCTLFVGIYSEDGTKLITSQNIEVTKDDTLVTLTFDTSVVPTYFIIQAYLINTADLKPLCKVYNSNMYTKEMQEFLSKTTDDFESDKVLQLDDDKTNNFAVFNDTVEIIENNIQMTVTADVENGIYIITNPTDEVKALQVGDIFSYNYDNGEVLILKIASISTDEDGAITYTEGELELEDVFDYVKIDSTAPTNSATVDTSELDDGIVYYGCIENPSTYALVDVEASKKFSHSYEFFDYPIVDSEGDEGSAKTTISGSLDFSMSGTFKVFITFETSIVEIRFDYELKAAIELSASLKGCNILLGKVTIMPVTGIIVTVEPSFVLECSGKISFSGSVYGTIGVKLDTETGIENLTSIPRAKTEVEAEATIFIGLSFKPTVKILNERVAKASLDAVIGAEISVSTSTTLNTEEERHSCRNCLEGEIYGKFEMEYSIRLLNKDKLEFKFKILEVKLKITDFYISGDFNEFDFIKCPHKEYKLTVSVVDSKGKALKGLTVNIGDKNDTTNTFGNASVFLPSGSYTISIVNDKYIPVSSVVTIDDAPQKINVSAMDINSSASVVSASANKLCLGDYHSAIITEDGSLYIWGSNSQGQLGNGTTTNSTMPFKIMDNVVSVSLGNLHSAAITKDGSLYTWGYNIFGQLGDGTTTNSYKPKKIMTGIASVSLSFWHSAAIAKDGSLYTWGRNNSGQLGNGTTTESLTPVKIIIPKITTYSLRNTVINFNEFTDLIPNFVYNYYVMEAESVANPLNSQNLKFMGQAVSDEEGRLLIPEYTADIVSSEATIVLKEFVRISGEIEYLISSEDTAIITGSTAKNAVFIPEKLGDYTPTAIANMAFESCYNLTDVTLTNSITEIADGTFFAQENITLHSSCQNDNAYFESYTADQEIEFSVIHNFGEISLKEVPTDKEDGSITHVCANCNHNEVLSLPYLKFTTALDIVNGAPLIKLKLPENIFMDNGYENIGITINGKVVELNEEDKYYNISSIAYSNNWDLKFTADIVADVCGQRFETNCCESINSIADVNSDEKFNIADLVRMKKNIASMKDCDINGDDDSDAHDLLLLRKLLLFKS